MNRDAKIGIVVILAIVGLLVIIWGRSESTRDRDRNAGLPREEGTRTADGRAAPDGGGTHAGGTSSLNLPIPHDSTMPRPTGTGLVAGTITDATGATGTAGTSTAGVTGVTGTTGTTLTDVRPEPKVWEYTVAQGDRGLEYIARTKLGDPKRWKEIAKLNNMREPYRLSVGQKLKMPPKEQASTASAAAAAGAAGTPTAGTAAIGTTDTGTAAAAGTGTMTASTAGTAAGGTTTTATASTGTAAATAHRKYVVRDDDLGLITIAREQLGDAKRWKKIAEINNLRDPYRIHVGQTLFLPD